MKNNKKNYFNFYVLISTFGRNLIEIFVPLILYKSGFTLKNIMLFYALIYGFGIFLCYPLVSFGKNISNKLLTSISVISFGILMTLLNNVNISLEYLILVSFVYSLYRNGYWLSRRFYNFKIIKHENIGKNSSITSMLDQLGKVIATYIGALYLDNNLIHILGIIAAVVYLLSLIPLMRMKFKKAHINVKLDIVNTFKHFDVNNVYLIGSYELVKLVQFLIPLYLFIYVKNTFQIIGILSVCTNLSVLFFAYLYGKTIDKSKNLLKLSIFLSVLAFALKINVVGVSLIIVSIMEGIVTKMYDVSISKEIFMLSKKFEYNNYNLAYEIILNAFRCSVGFLLYIAINDVVTMIYFTLLVMFLGVFISFKQPNIKDYILENNI